jgi:hypothetical protein
MKKVWLAMPVIVRRIVSINKGIIPKRNGGPTLAGGHRLRTYKDQLT